jgi:hypothetical protein
MNATRVADARRMQTRRHQLSQKGRHGDENDGRWALTSVQFAENGPAPTLWSPCRANARRRASRHISPCGPIGDWRCGAADVDQK